MVTGNYTLSLSTAEIARYRAMAELAAATEAQSWTQAGIAAGADVLDVGCGPGALLPTFARLVGPSGSVTGLDADPDAVGAARAYLADAQLRGVEVHEATATDTGLAAASFDVISVRHVLAHNGPQEAQIVDHLATLLRPAGCLYLVDVDTNAVRLRPEDLEVADLNQRYRTLHAKRGNDLQTGTRLDELIEHAGLDLVEYHGRYQILPLPRGLRPPAWAARNALVEAGLATPDDVARWDMAMSRLDDAPKRPTVFVAQFTAIGRRPA